MVVESPAPSVKATLPKSNWKTLQTGLGPSPLSRSLCSKKRSCKCLGIICAFAAAPWNLGRSTCGASEGGCVPSMFPGHDRGKRCCWTYPCFCLPCTQHRLHQDPCLLSIQLAWIVVSPWKQILEKGKPCSKIPSTSYGSYGGSHFPWGDMAIRECLCYGSKKLQVLWASGQKKQRAWDVCSLLKIQGWETLPPGTDQIDSS